MAMRILLTILGLTATASAQQVDFDTQVLPILTKAGCNSGACHGAAAGRGELQLSLYGSRPEADFQQLTRALEGRRIHHRKPEQSLLLLKPTEQVSHEGGTRLDSDSADYATVLSWIRQGAARQPLRQLVQFTFQRQSSGPAADAVLQVGQSVPLSAVAEFSDGSQDVLKWTVIQSADHSAASVSASGVVTVHRPGRHLIIARFLDRVVPLEFLVTADTKTGDVASLPVATSASEETQLDHFIDQRLRQLQLDTAPILSDHGFARRLHLDLTGRLPEPAIVAQLQGDSAPDKRTQMIDRLLQSADFTEYWAWVFSRLLRVSAVKTDARATREATAQVDAMSNYYEWIRESIATDIGLDHLVRQLILAEGSPSTHGPAGFYAVTADARAQAEFFSRAFLGVRLQCANCHDHPLDAWTQDDYHGLAAIFAGIRSQPVVRFVASSEIIHPATQEPAIPKIPGGQQLVLHQDQRPQLVEWLTAKNNPYFAKALVNRIWKQLLGEGLVEPVDDLRVTNPATHPELLNWLAAELITDSYQLRPTIRRICNSRVYQRSCATAAAAEQSVSRTEDSPTDDLTATQAQTAMTELQRSFYAVGRTKPLDAAVYLDAVADVTGVGSFALHSSARAVSLAGIWSGAKQLQPLGQCAAEECEDQNNVAELPLRLHLLTGDTLNSRVSNPQSRLMQAVAAGAQADELLDLFYPLAFSRSALPVERRFWQQQFDAAQDRQQFGEIAQDFLWSLLNSSEFRTNH